MGIFFTAQGQYSLDALLVGEEFGLGGDIGRGYDFSEITGDHGIGASLEFQKGFDVGYDYLQNTQLYIFYDVGAVWQEDRQAAIEASKESLNSAGLGMRFNFIEAFSGYLQLAKPMSRNVGSEGDNDIRPHFGISYVF